MSRKSKIFTPELAMEICQLVADGASLRAICRRDDMPCRSIIHEWLLENEDFAKKYGFAQGLRADDLFDEALEIADTGKDVARDRLRVDTRKWACGRMAPQKYGDRVVNEMVGQGGGPLIINLVKYGSEDDGNPPSK